MESELLRLVIDIVGWVGGLTVLLAYALVSLGRVQAKSGVYQGMNLLGGLCLTANTLYLGAYPSAFVNFVWAIVGIYALIKGIAKS